MDDLDMDSEDDVEDSEDDEDRLCPRICLTKMEKAILRKPWRHSLIIKMFDKNIGYLALMRKLQAKWSIKGILILTDLTNLYYVARFSSKEDYEFVITQGPWMIDDHYLTIRKWVPNFVPSEDRIKYLTAWVRIPNLPVEYFNETFLRKIGSKIGKVIRIDKNTAAVECGQFTRMSVEVDISMPLLSKFLLYGKVYTIQYEGLKMICFKCGRVGHNSESCLKTAEGDNEMDFENQTSTIETIPQKPVANLLEAGLCAEEEANFGDWMMVKKPPRLMEVKINLVKDEPSSLAMEMSIPWSIDRILKLVSNAYLSSLNYLPDFMNTRIPSYKPTVLALVETHMDGDHAIKIGNIIGYDGHSRVNVIGFRGGIWFYWKTDIVSIQPVTEHLQYMTLEISRNGEPPWFFSAVYASPDPSNRRELWVELEEFGRNNNRPWLLAGDFNETRTLSERHGGDDNMARRCNNFNNWIENCDLIDLAFTGAAHT
ncbi:uncharacterized protein LOC141641732 [Silene latifolia]|uniref:uncharacterized protein LOC141641732 n=1 Tax=Silene latifolia TaxID=37657 RepID=UPI003D76CDD5